MSDQTNTEKTERGTRTLHSLVWNQRANHILETRELAEKHGMCNEQHEDGKCAYPHCNCLFTKEGPIDPKTGMLLIPNRADIWKISMDCDIE
jgi:hypothetical protein